MKLPNAVGHKAFPRASLFGSKKCTQTGEADQPGIFAQIVSHMFPVTLEQFIGAITAQCHFNFGTRITAEHIKIKCRGISKRWHAWPRSPGRQMPSWRAWPCV